MANRQARILLWPAFFNDSKHLVLKPFAGMQAPGARESLFQRT
jgi:hypothetical protein